MSDLRSVIIASISAFGRFWSEFRHLFGSGMVHLQTEGGQVSLDSTVDLHTQDCGEAPDTSINTTSSRSMAYVRILSAVTQDIYERRFIFSFRHFFIPSVLQK